MSRRKTQWLVATFALLVGGAQARADITWGYNWTPGTLAINADGSTGGYVSFTNEPPNSASDSSDIVTTNLRTVSSAKPSSPDKLVANGAYTLTLVVTDTLSGQSANKVFSGKLGGTFSNSNANVSNSFTGLTTQVAILGNLATGFRTYTITIGPYTPPGPPGASNAGSISAHIAVVDDGGGTINKVPEPSTLALSFLGLSFAGGAAWRKRRAAL